MKKKMLSIVTILTALMALLMVTANAGDSVDPEPSAADGWRCTQAIYSVQDDGVKDEVTKTVYVYDDNGVLTESDEYAKLYSGDWSTEASKTTYSYDSTGKCTGKVADPMGLVSTAYTYDSMGRLSTETSENMGMESTTTYSYDSQGRRVSATITANVYEMELITNVTYTYNSAGQCIKKSEGGGEGGREYNYSYDSNGNKVKDIVDGAIFIDYEYEKVGTDNNSDSPFADVQNSGIYFYEPVLWAADKGIVYGVDDTHFAPNDTCTRAQVVTFLYRAAGKPEVTATENPFTDVKESDYFYKAVLWGYQNKIVYGTSDTTFGPNEKVTRSQFVTFLWRFAEKPSASSTASPFVDLPENKYYTTAVLWGNEKKIVYGTDTDKFSPDDTCTRAQVVTFLYRYMEKQ